MHLRHEKLAVTGTDGQLLVIYHAEPASESAQALTLLGSLTATPGIHDTPAPNPAKRRM